MATKTIRENFINTFGTDLLIAYFDPGADRNGAGRYNFASYAICNDNDWLKAIGAIRTAACLFKLPIDASASVDIVLDTTDPNFKTAFFVQIHRSSHQLDTACNPPVGVNLLIDASMSAVEQVHRAVADALLVLREEPLSMAESAASAQLARPTCSLSQPCGGRSTTSCSDPIGTVAECIQLPSGVYDIVCVPRTASLVVSEEPGL